MVEITVTGKDYDKCLESSGNRWSNTKKGAYGRGIINSKDDPHKAERLGCLGETALSLYLDLPIEFEYIKGGDDGDMEYQGKKLDIKTSAKYPKYAAGLIYAMSGSGKKITLKSDLYVFGYLIGECRGSKSATIGLLGYQVKEWIEKLAMKPAKQGFHLNYEIPFNELIDIENLKSLTK